MPLDATAETALSALRRADRGVRKAVVLAALKARRKVPACRPFRFRNRDFETQSGTARNWTSVRQAAPQIGAGFPVPGTVGNRPESNGSRFFPSLDGNRDQDQIRSGPVSLEDLFSQTEREPIRGGCDQCSAYQTVIVEEPGIYRLTVHHDDWCPVLRAAKAGRTDDVASPSQGQSVRT